MGGKHYNKMHLRLTPKHPKYHLTYCGITITDQYTTHDTTAVTCYNCLIVYRKNNTNAPPPFSLPPSKVYHHHSDYAWNINQEKRYLDHLGTGKWSNARTSRHKLLQSYIDTIDLRYDRWTKEAKVYATQLLKQEQGARR